MVRRVLIFCLVLCLLIICKASTQDIIIPTTETGTEEHSTPIESPAPEAPKETAASSIDRHAAARYRALELLSQYDADTRVDEAFLSWACDNVTPDFAVKLADSLEANGWDGEPFYELFGETLHVLWDRYTGKLESSPDVHQAGTLDTATLAFVGDVNMADNWENMQAYRTQSNGVEGVISAPLLERMRNADVLLANNEFCFSDRGAPAAGKQYTFRAAKENVRLYYDLGVDIVSLANNHVFDYGEQAFYDTLNTLSEAGIPYIGAGQDIAEAARIQYFHTGGMKVAYIAAAHTEIFRFTPPAGAEAPGVLPCFDGSLLETVAIARASSDWVVVYLHWGTEYATTLDNQQVSLARELVDNGADIVVGAHPHVLQGIEFYEGKPIAYSIGNFWFNVGWVNTALLEIELTKPDQYRLRVHPCATARGTVRLMEGDDERRALFKHLENISEGILIEDDGTVTSRS